MMMPCKKCIDWAFSRACASYPAVAGAKAVREFVSHCAVEGPEAVSPAKMTVAQLSAALRAKGLPLKGKTLREIQQLCGCLHGSLWRCEGRGFPSEAEP
jgi:hypothetical protein